VHCKLNGGVYMSIDMHKEGIGVRDDIVRERGICVSIRPRTKIEMVHAPPPRREMGRLGAEEIRREIENEIF
jgi:hypothetical protein